MTDVVEFHMEDRMEKDDLELENSSDSGLDECSTSPASSNRSSASPSSSYELDHTKTHIPFRPQIITPSESSAFSKIEKLVSPTEQSPTSPTFNFGVPPAVGYFPGLFIPPWMVNNGIQQPYSSPSYNKATANSDSETDDQKDNEAAKNAFTEVDTSIPFTNYFQNLTKLLKKTSSEEMKPQHENEEQFENEPGEITKGSRQEQLNLYFSRYSSMGSQNVQANNLDQNEIKNQGGVSPLSGLFPNGHVLSMSNLIGPHPYFSASTPTQLSPNSQMLQYFGGVQPPTGLLHPALLHMAGLRNRRINTEKPPPIKKYKCDVCGKAFSRSNTLVTHKRIHTGDKPFKCEVCGRAFRQPGNLTRHRLTHTTVKPYVCPSCNKAFNRASNLHTHMRTHTNFKPFTCPYCGKGFHQKIDMKIHCYTHTGERPHRCDICGKGFTLISTLNAHRRIHTENIPGTEMS